MESGCRPFRDERISGSDELLAGRYFYLLGAFAGELDSHAEGRRAYSPDMKFICPCASRGVNSLMVVFIFALGIAALVLLSFMGTGGGKR